MGFFPLGFAIAFVMAFGVPVILALPVLVQAGFYRPDDVTAENWDSLIDEVGKSLDPIERDSLYMGRNAHDGSPLLVPRELFREHCAFSRRQRCWEDLTWLSSIAGATRLPR